MFFRNERWARLFIETMYDYREKGLFQLHAFVVMPEHFHILLTPATTLEKTVQHLKGGFSRNARLKFDWKFPIWQKSFTDHRIRDAADCDNHIQYIYRNPIKRKLCAVPSDYPYSSAYPGFELDELPQRLKPEWWECLDGTALHPSSRNSSACWGPGESRAPSKEARSEWNRDEWRNLRITEANTAAIPFILSIQSGSPAASHWKHADYDAALAEPHRLVLIAEKDSRILGFLVAYTGIPEWELENIAVAAELRRNGIGRALIIALIDRAREAHAAEIRQEIRASNMSAQKLGLSVGFIQEGRRRNYYRDPVEDALLLKHLLGRL